MSDGYVKPTGVFFYKLVTYWKIIPAVWQVPLAMTNVSVARGFSLKKREV